MIKKTSLSIVVSTLFASSAFAGGGVEIAGGKLSGDIRVGYHGHNTAEYGTHDAHDVSATGLGLNPVFGMEVASGLSVEVGAGVAVPLAESEDAAAAHDFAFGKENDDGDASETYAVLNKYNINYDFGAGSVKAGAQDMATPFFDGDDVRLVPNTFTAVVANYTGVKDLTLSISHIMSMAGAVDGGADDPETMNSMSTQAFGSTADDKPVNAISAVYESEDAGLNGQLWHMMMDEPDAATGAVSASYIDIGKKLGIVNVSAQYVTYATDLQSNTATGVMAEIELGDFGLTAAMNNYSFTDDGIGAMAAPGYNAWGGYPEYVAGEEVDGSIADWDGGSASLIGISYGGVEHLDASVTYMTFSDVANVIDVVVGYGINEHTHISAVYELVDVEDDDHDGDQTVTKAHLSYHF